MVLRCARETRDGAGCAGRREPQGDGIGPLVREACRHATGKLSTGAARIMENAAAKGNRDARDAVLRITTIRPSLALSLAGAAICIALAAVSLAGCAGGEAPSAQPSFYQNLAQPDMTVDPA